MVASAQRRTRPRDLARTLLTLSAVLPGLAAGLASWLATRDPRRARNRAIALWGRLGTAAAGIRLEVEGARHLALRPAVFLINHQSGIDPILVCALLERDVVGVAKSELRRNPLLGPAFAFAGSVFLDRSDRVQSVRALQPAVDTLHSGIAVAVAPEGTRGDGARLGPFKKGAFRLALAAKVPVVPIAIENAADVLPRGARVMTAATVRVRVGAPIATDGWSVERLDGHVEDVRRAFLALLHPAA